jgi:hypothetical protein
MHVLRDRASKLAYTFSLFLIAFLFLFVELLVTRLAKIQFGLLLQNLVLSLAVASFGFGALLPGRALNRLFWAYPLSLAPPFLALAFAGAGWAISPWLFLAALLGHFLLTGSLLSGLLERHRHEIHAAFALVLLGSAAGAVGSIAALDIGGHALALRLCLLAFAVPALARRRAIEAAAAFTLATLALAALPRGIAEPSCGRELTYARTGEWAQRSTDAALSNSFSYLEARSRAPGWWNVAIDCDTRTQVLALGPSVAAYAEPYSHEARPALLGPFPDVLVLGAGGGAELTQYLGSSKNIVAVEQNPLMKTVEERLVPRAASVTSDPAVHFVYQEARHYLARSSERFDLIQLGFLTHLSGPGLKEFVFMVNQVHTREAFASYLAHLKPGGMLYVRERPGVVVRFLAGLRGALADAGAQPGRDLLVLRNPRGSPYVHVFVKPAGFTDAELATLGSVSVPWEGANLATTQGHPLTDDTPYLWAADAPPAPPAKAAAGKAPHVYEATAIYRLNGFTLALFLLGFFLPLLRGYRIRGFAPAGLYFASTGAGFLFLEVALAQLFSLSFSNAMRALSAVVTVLLLFAGIGSHLSGACPPGRIRTVLLAATAGTSAAFGALYFASSSILPSMNANTDPVNAAIVLAILAVPALLLGLYFPLGSRSLLTREPGLFGYAYCMNGLGSVLGGAVSILATGLLGLRLTLLLGVACYLGTIPGILWGTKKGAPPRSAG